MSRIRPRILTAVLALGLTPTRVPAEAPRAETPSALDRDPEGWVDLLAGAGPELKGWTRGPMPAGGTLRAASQWSIDPATHLLVCQGDGGHEWLRWDGELDDFIYHVEWRFTPVEGKTGYNSGIYARNSADGRVWHQAQTGDATGGFLFGDTLV
ncbi:MAG TPA: family 16 glycoside hydrolase, partial [Isosphaeraceae bacterium]